jgi:hypothetical protein
MIRLSAIRPLRVVAEYPQAPFGALKFASSLAGFFNPSSIFSHPKNRLNSSTAGEEIFMIRLSGRASRDDRHTNGAPDEHSMPGRNALYGAFS